MRHRVASLVLLVVALLCPILGLSIPAGASSLRSLVSDLSGWESRSTASAGAEQAASYIEKRLSDLGLSPQSYYYQIAKRQVGQSTLQMDGRQYPLKPFFYNAITPESSGETLTGPVYYLGSGSLAQLDGIPIKDSIILLDFASARNWQRVASLGARAIIYLGRGGESRFSFQEKQELSPLQLPCYWMPREDAEAFFARPLKKADRVASQIKISTDIGWENSLSRNIYAFIPGTESGQDQELLLLEAFYDDEEMVYRDSPGADAALSIASLLDVAENLVQTPPKRSVLLLATSGNSQSLAGMRDAIWSIVSRGKDLKKEDSRLNGGIAQKEQTLLALQDIRFPLPADKVRDRLLRGAIAQTLSSHIDNLSRRVMELRLGEKSKLRRQQIKKLAAERLLYKQLSWQSHYHDLDGKKERLLQGLLPQVILSYKRGIEGLAVQKKCLDSALAFRRQVKEYRLAAAISLHLSGHGTGIGAFHRGWLYPLKSSVNRTGIYSLIADVLEESNLQGGRAEYQNTLRPTLMRSWNSWFLDKPALGGEVSSLAGLLGISLVTTGDARALWGTPGDLAKNIDWDYVEGQNELLLSLVRGLCAAPRLDMGRFPRKGFAQLTGRANLLLQGELFASFPAKGTTVLAYQGLARYYAMVDGEGLFRIVGLADKKNVGDKVILEGYRFAPDGRAIWAIDKRDTGKSNYRVKMLRKNMQTDLTMFACQQITIFDLLEPRNLDYMTKIQVYDGRRDAPPQHYWYSRIDTRKSAICSVFTEPGTPVKLTLSDTVLTTKMLLTNSHEEKVGGVGFKGSDYPQINRTAYAAARDAWALLGPRIKNLQSHGIYDSRIDDLKVRGLLALHNAERDYQNLKYSSAQEEAASSLALSTRVYTEVEKTQKDVLFGVLFYIALFVPFAFVMERFIFNYAHIYKRISAFLLILFLLIAIIYQVHPAFELAYSPLIIVLAFFIIGLSLLVTLIIFFRFEREMIRLQNQANHYRPEEISHWKAFVAAFFLGVSNLRRRRLRTMLTCLTLIILSFTIMSFTTIKSGQQHLRLPFGAKAPYQGLLLEKRDWKTLPTDATDILKSSMAGSSKAAPRAWLEAVPPTRPVHVPLTRGNKNIEVNGVLGLSVNEAEVTGISRLLTTGHWFTSDNAQSVILADEIAAKLGITGMKDARILLWGIPFTVIATFDSKGLEAMADLDGEALTPVIFPEEQQQELSDAEQEAVEQGDDIQSFQSRYQHIGADKTIIIPVNTLLAAGGSLKSIAIRPDYQEGQAGEITREAGLLVDRFNLVIFAGDEDGVWLYNATDTISYSGVPNIIIPLLISVFIVLNTMISSVQERRGEIGVYTSIGLAPSHVAFLFVAEALALAVVSVVIGYLLAQISAYFLSTTSLWQGITVNYSSLAGVASMFLVIMVVLISVIYPARMASKIAIPDVNKTFSLPKDDGHSMKITLPFLLKQNEADSLGGFLFSYFNAHLEVSHGLFSTAKLSLEKNSDKEVYCSICCQTWLAPFDLGIMQEVEVTLENDKTFTDDDFLSVQVHIRREAGEVAAWRRMNTVFFHQLRKQLLVWRSLDGAGHCEQEAIFAEKTGLQGSSQS
ncbi:FtsX-like permease family protein [Desulfotalea psychrophila]|nr:FtsX-like permease family protein [Desulfotalea psychrophila]